MAKKNAKRGKLLVPPICRFQYVKRSAVRNPHIKLQVYKSYICRYIFFFGQREIPRNNFDGINKISP